MANYNNYVIIKAADEDWESHPYSGGQELGGASLCGVATGIEESGICWVNPADTSAPVPAEEQNPHLSPDRGNGAQIEEYFHSMQDIAVKTEQPCLDDQMRAARHTASGNGIYSCFLSGHDCTIEYIAGAACAWFGTGYDAQEYGYNDPVTGERRKIDTREKLKKYDYQAWNVMRQLFGDDDWIPCPGYHGPGGDASITPTNSPGHKGPEEGPECTGGSKYWWYYNPIPHKEYIGLAIAGLVLYSICFVATCGRWLRLRGRLGDQADAAEEGDPSSPLSSSAAGQGGGPKVDERTRMYLNGETAAQMAHAAEVKKRNDDTSVDQPWSCEESLRWRDTFVLTTSALWLLPKALILWLPMIIFSVPFVLGLFFCVSRLPTPCDTLNRSSHWYQFYCFVMSVVGLPLLLLAFVSYFLDCVMYYFIGIIFCTLTRGWGSYCKGIAAIRPYTNGPSFLCHWSDVVTGLMGQVWRHGIFESIMMVSAMFLFIPWIKYYVNCNPLIYPLEERMVQQISTSMQDMSVADISKACLRIISRTKQHTGMQEDLDKWRFVPHYPYPPPWKRWTVGIQAGGSRPPTMFFLFVHTTHALCTHGDSTEQFVLSNSAEAAGYRVMLWYNNPYHFFTGWVEASVTHGRPSQTDKNRGGEHPMWLVSSRSPLLSDRRSMTGTGWIDNFFDEWLPSIVDKIREINQGMDAVEKLREPVISKDGASRPKLGKSVPLVEAGTPDAAYFHHDKLI
jgi:hypothetical protein